MLPRIFRINKPFSLLLASAVAASTLAMISSTAAQAASHATPKNLKVVSATTSTLGLDWDDVPKAKLYRVQYSTSSSMSNAKYIRFKESKGTLTDLARGKRYYVRAVVIDPKKFNKLSAYTGKPYPYGATLASDPTTPPPTTPPSGAASDINVASFNIFGVNDDVGSNPKNKATSWINRRGAVVEDIVGQNSDVVGLQEANQSSVYNDRGGYDYLPDGDTQFLDLVALLNKGSGDWAATVNAYYNCERSTSSTSCKYVDRGASNGTRIIFRNDRLEKLAAGSVKYSTQHNETDRYLAWAKFRVRETGKTFTFFTTHLSPNSESVRTAQWRQLIKEVNRISAGDKVVVTGDFNVSKFRTPAQDMLPAMKSNGYGDVLNQTYKNNNATSPRARTLVDAYVNSYNGFERDINGGSKCYCGQVGKIGNNIDWIFASNDLVVKRWETVSDLNGSYDQVGPIASDHFMVSSTLVLP